MRVFVIWRAGASSPYSLRARLDGRAHSEMREPTRLMLLAACFSVAFAVRAAERPLCFHASMPTNAADFGGLMRRGAAAMREQWRSGLERRKASRIESQRRREGNDDSYPPAFDSAALVTSLAGWDTGSNAFF